MNEITKFTNSINAQPIQDFSSREILSRYESCWESHPNFRSRNYFVLKTQDAVVILIVKISRLRPRPWWGVGEKFINFFNKLQSVKYFLVLLDSENSGWFYSKEDVIENCNHRWSFSAPDYKINYGDLPDNNRFLSPNKFISKLNE